jgi:hypothetical protein
MMHEDGGGISDKNLVPMGSKSFEDLKKVNENISLPAPAN